MVPADSSSSCAPIAWVRGTGGFTRSRRRQPATPGTRPRPLRFVRRRSTFPASDDRRFGTARSNCLRSRARRRGSCREVGLLHEVEALTAPLLPNVDRSGTDLAVVNSYVSTGAPIEWPFYGL